MFLPYRNVVDACAFISDLEEYEGRSPIFFMYTQSWFTQLINQLDTKIACSLLLHKLEAPEDIQRVYKDHTTM